MGKLIVIEGSSDGSGKQTQSEILYKTLLEKGYKVRKITFPNYESEACNPIKMYLRGDFGNSPEDINPYTASTFYAIDRFASFKTEWQEFYNEQDTIIIADRYVTSNYIHQGSKFNTKSSLNKYCKWLSHLEYEANNIPSPDLVIYLHMPFEFSKKLLEDRRKNNGEPKDIHETHLSYLKKSYLTSLYISEKFKWNKIECTEDYKLKTIDSISKEIYKKVYEILLKK